MSFFKSLIIIAPLALSGAAFAQDVHFNDAQYIAAARCQALMSSSALGRQDTRAIDSRLASEDGMRVGAAYDQAGHARDDASRAALHSGAYGRAALRAERDGLCRSLTGGESLSATAEQARASRSN